MGGHDWKDGQMMRRLLQVWRMPWSALFGAAIGVMVVLGTPEMVAPLRQAYDSFRPVLEMTGKVVERDADSVILHIKGKKLRGEECRLLAVYGYSIDSEGRLADAIATRVDMNTTGRARDKGDYDIGMWRVRPVAKDAVSVRVVAQHDCVGRVILSVIAEANL